jgi:hypothetical protein
MGGVDGAGRAVGEGKTFPDIVDENRPLPRDLRFFARQHAEGGKSTPEERVPRKARVPGAVDIDPSGWADEPTSKI